jgi:AcrR family transcriptional regulator
MPTTRTTGAHEPKRQRGHLRVAAILEAGVAVFTEKGYDAATMTEIAARSGTAIGSLYRFFPSKDVLADAWSATRNT